MRRVVLAFLLIELLFVNAASCQQPDTLLGRFASWRYPNCHAVDGTMADAATVDANGKRTVPSMVCRVATSTPDPIDKVVEHYRKLLIDDADPSTPRVGLARDGESVSVTALESSAGRPLTIHVFTVVRDNETSTLVISRAEGEDKTHIVWSQYSRLSL